MKPRALLTSVVCFLFLAGCGAEKQPKPEPPARPPEGSAPAAGLVKVKAAVEKAAAFLAAQQNADGSYGEEKLKMNSMVGLTGLAVLALAESGAAPGGTGGKAIADGVAFILKHRQPDGGIYIPKLGANSYETSIAVMALAAVEEVRYKADIEKAVNYIKGIQDDGSKNPLSAGGIGYGSDKTQSNLSTTHYALQALKAAGVKEDDEAWKRAIAFVAACQNNSETNKLKYAAVVNDGGFIYSPTGSKSGKVTVRGRTGWRSYGSMSYAGYLSYVYAKLGSEDARVKGVERWISAAENYTLDENPGMKNEGLYYYYHTFALALDARGGKTLKTSDGVEHDWAAELGARLVSLQDPDGSWRNEASRWYEASRVICTSYSLRALSRAAARLGK